MVFLPTGSIQLQIVCEFPKHLSSFVDKYKFNFVHCKHKKLSFSLYNKLSYSWRLWTDPIPTKVFFDRHKTYTISHKSSLSIPFSKSLLQHGSQAHNIIHPNIWQAQNTLGLLLSLLLFREIYLMTRNKHSRNLDQNGDITSFG